MQETWTTRDLPVLRAIVELDEASDGSFITELQVAERLNFDLAVVRRAMRALSKEDPPFAAIQVSSMAGDYDAHSVTGHARRTVGQWPAPMTAEQQAAALVEVLRQAEEDAPDEASKSTIRKMREGLTSLPMQVVSALGTAAALKLSGLG